MVPLTIINGQRVSCSVCTIDCADWLTSRGRDLRLPKGFPPFLTSDQDYKPIRKYSVHLYVFPFSCSRRVRLECSTNLTSSRTWSISFQLLVPFLVSRTSSPPARPHRGTSLDPTRLPKTLLLKTRLTTSFTVCLQLGAE